MQLTSTAFEAGRPLPRPHTGDGKDISPPLEWSAAPDGVRTFALVCDDPDSKTQWTHWLIYNLPHETTRLPEAVPPETTVLGGALQGQNDFGRIGYGGPAPPPGKRHRYVFRLCALDRLLDLRPSATKTQLLSAMQGHVIAEAQLIGTYERQP